VQAEDGPHAVERAQRHDLARAAAPLLRGLEHQRHAARQRPLPRLEQPRRAQQHGRVRVVPARVHAARVGAAPGRVHGLLNRQAVHVGAQRDGVGRGADARGALLPTAQALN
jgi:hypothetical protein